MKLSKELKQPGVVPALVVLLAFLFLLYIVLSLTASAITDYISGTS
jgi:hypothetical protein